MPTYFISRGPFRLSRHPMYLGMMCIILGAAIFLGSLAAFACPVIFTVIMDRIFITMEEANLERKFGREYLDYKKRARRWI